MTSTPADVPAEPEPPGARFRRLRPGDWWVYGAVTSLLVLAGLAPPLWSRLDARLRVTQRFYAAGEAAERDPWGQPWVETVGRQPYSIGPNGRDEGGRGDDVLVTEPGASGDWRLPLHESLAGLLCSLAALLLVGWEGARLARHQLLGPRSPRLSTELLRAAGWAIPLTVFVGLGVVGLARLEATAPLIEAAFDGLRESLVVPLPLALLTSTYAAAFLLLLGLRLSQPRQALAPEDDSGLEGSRGPSR